MRTAALILAAMMLAGGMSACTGSAPAATVSVPPPLATPTAAKAQAEATATEAAQPSIRAQSAATQVAAASNPAAVPQAKAVEPNGAAPGAPYNTASPAASTAAPEADARYTVDKFLAALKQDHSGKSAEPYLASDLRQQAQSGKPIVSLLGIQSPYQSYSVDAAKPTGATEADVTASLQVGQSKEKRTFMVVKQGSTWLIQKIGAA